MTRSLSPSIALAFGFALLAAVLFGFVIYDEIREDAPARDNPFETTYNISDDKDLRRWIDHDAGVVCYQSNLNNGGIDCLAVNKTQLGQ